MRILGINCLNHDAAISVIEDRKIIFAAHSERYSRQKNDMHLNDEIIQEALSYGEPDRIAYYERPWIKKTRQLYAGQYKEVFDLNNLPSKYLKPWIDSKKINYIDHHLSHAASTYYLSGFNESLILTIDGSGEEHATIIWKGNGTNITKVKEINLPNSLGWFYSAITEFLGFKAYTGEG